MKRRNHKVFVDVEPKELTSEQLKLQENSILSVKKTMEENKPNIPKSPIFQEYKRQMDAVRVK